MRDASRPSEGGVMADSGALMVERVGWGLAAEMWCHVREYASRVCMRKKRGKVSAIVVGLCNPLRSMSRWRHVLSGPYQANCLRHLESPLIRITGWRRRGSEFSIWFGGLALFVYHSV